LVFGMHMNRPKTSGRGLCLGDEKLHVRGVTYGTFQPVAGSPFPPPEQVSRDFQAMAAHRVNAVRVYEVPPRWLLDLAQTHGLRVMVGVPWEQHITFLDDPGRAQSIIERVRAGVRSCAGHPAVLCYAIGNEIPAAIVRWHGRRRVERFLRRLYRVAKAADPEALVTYASYPSTEYLDLGFADLACFNVFLEEEQAFARYVARLQNIAGNRPLLVTESGLDSRRGGVRAQADALAWQVRHTFASGAAGIFVFSWTDEWHRGGHDVLDWDFGLTDRTRQPKPSLAAVRTAFEGVPFPHEGPWPRISVVVCTHNGARTLPECLDHLRELDYPQFEVIVVNDGSSDATAEIVAERGFTLLNTDHQGLASARNAGLAAATGEIVAYLDDDAYPDPDWLHYLAASFAESDHAAVGGPNIPPPGEGVVARCVAGAPGGPMHVLVSDHEAEHIPGCNMAFRRSNLEAIGGFDPAFWTAGDDVDICWKLQEAGQTVGFSPGAVVFHRRRDSIRKYLGQQYGYGKAEALLERRWPSRYTRHGYLAWTGRIYGNGTATESRRRKVHYGQWGKGLFQSLHSPAPGFLSSLPLMPEAHLAIAALGVLSLLAVLWSPLLLALPLFAASAVAMALAALASEGAAAAAATGTSRLDRARRRALTSLLFMVQPLVRLAGRVRVALFAQPGRGAPTLPRARTVSLWSERWRSHQSRVTDLEQSLVEAGGVVRRGGAYDRWDLEVRRGLLGAVSVRTVVEEHGGGRQMMRTRVWPRPSRALGAAPLLAALAVLAWLDGAQGAAAILSAGALTIAGLALVDTSAAMRIALEALRRLPEVDEARLASDANEGPIDLLKALRVMERARRSPAPRPEPTNANANGNGDGAASPHDGNTPHEHPHRVAP
jgi:O-antigen biosynthesis protein